MSAATRRRWPRTFTPCSLRSSQISPGALEAAEAYLADLKKQRRYQRDVYQEPQASERTPSKNEEIKEASRFLRGGIADGLSKSDTGAIAEDDAQLTKFHGTYLQDDRDLRPERRKKKMEQAYSFMIRVRVPGGVCTPAQWLAMDRIATDYANGTLRLTTRQAFQFHGVIKSNLKRSMQAINTALLDTVAACGDVNRNVMCNPNPYQSRAQAGARARAIWRSPQPTNGRLSRDLAGWREGGRHPGGRGADLRPHYLPRKFKTVIAVPPSNDVDVFAQDLGFIAITGENDEVGYDVAVGGGMGMTHGEPETFPRTADVMGFCRPEQAVDVAESGPGAARLRRSQQSQARAPQVHDRGPRHRLVPRRGRAPPGPPSRRRGRSRSSTPATVRLGAGPRGQLALHAVRAERPRARPADRPMRTGLAEIARVHQGDFRLTANQNLMIARVRPRQKRRIEQLLAQYRLDNDHSRLRLNSLACVALPTCGLALAESDATCRTS